MYVFGYQLYNVCLHRIQFACKTKYTLPSGFRMQIREEKNSKEMSENPILLFLKVY